MLKIIDLCRFFLLLYIKLRSYVKNTRLLYCLFCSLFFLSLRVFSQSANNDAVVTIIGNPALSNVNTLDNNIGNGNYYQQQANEPPAPAQQQFAETNQNVEPSLENGFHMRFQVTSPQSVERVTSYGSSSSSSSGAKVKKHAVSLSERSFNFKKKFKNWFPHLKKKYRPTLCEKFR